MKTFDHAFIDAEPDVQLQLTNGTDATLRTVEILTIFLRDEAAPGSPSQAHIRFAPLAVVRPNEQVVVPHKTWINGKAVDSRDDQMARLKPTAGAIHPYVLDISWQDREGKTCFQRIPVGH